jgi:hypothetical protein
MKILIFIRVIDFFNFLNDLYRICLNNGNNNIKLKDYIKAK